MLAIVRHATQAEPSRSIHIALIAIAFLAAFMTWKHVETPWRRGGRVSARAIAALSIVGLSAIAIVGRIGHAMGGFPAVPPVADLATPGSASRPVPRIMLLGDSHAGHLYPGLDAVMSGRVIERTRAGCTTLIDLERHDRRSEPGACVRFTRDALDEFLSSPSLDRLVVSMMGPVYFDNTTFHGNDEARVLGQRVELVGRPDVRERWRMFEIGLRDTLALLDRHADKHVVFVLDVPELGRPVCPRSSKAIHLFGLTVGDLVRSADPESCRVPRSEFDRRNETYHRVAQRVLAEFPRVSRVDPTDLFCDAQWCNGFIEGTGYIYRDYDHLNRAGSVLVARTLRRYLRDPADPTL